MNYDYVIKKTVQRVLQFIPQLLQVQDNDTLACLEDLNMIYIYFCLFLCFKNIFKFNIFYLF
jgi:hypothetical protein